MTWIRTATGALAIFGTATVLAMGHALIADPVLLSKKATPTAAALPGATPASRDPGTDSAGLSGDETDATADADASESTPAATDGNKITLEAAYALFEEGVPFIDARRASDFEAGRIEFAFHLPASRISAGEGYGVMEMLPLEGPTVIYCTGGDCSDSTNVEILLTHAGYSGFLIMNAGYDDWVAAGYPTEAGPIDGSVP